MKKLIHKVKKCENCKYYKYFKTQEFPCVDCDMRYKDRFEKRKIWRIGIIIRSKK